MRPLTAHDLKNMIPENFGTMPCPLCLNHHKNTPASCPVLREAAYWREKGLIQIQFGSHLSTRRTLQMIEDTCGDLFEMIRGKNGYYVPLYVKIVLNSTPDTRQYAVLKLLEIFDYSQKHRDALETMLVFASDMGIEKFLQSLLEIRCLRDLDEMDDPQSP